MKNYLQLWPQELLKLSSLTLKSKITVVGERNQHLGPRWESAKVQISVEPAPQFEVIDTAPADVESRNAGYLDWAVFGLMDVLMVAESAPLKNICVRIAGGLGGVHGDVDSSMLTFKTEDIEALLAPAFHFWQRPNWITIKM